MLRSHKAAVHEHGSTERRLCRDRKHEPQSSVSSTRPGVVTARRSVNGLLVLVEAGINLETFINAAVVRSSNDLSADL